MKKTLRTLNHMRKKAISLMLVVALVVTGVHLDTLSQSVYAAKETKTEKKENKKKKVVKELKSEQTENSNTYLMSDGTRKMEIYRDNIRYREKGTLKEYDSTLKKLSAGDRKELKKASKDITGEQAGKRQ